MNKKTRTALWWALPLVVLVLYFLFFPPREAEGPAIDNDSQDRLTSPDVPAVQSPAISVSN